MAELVVLSPHRDDAIFSLAAALAHWSRRASISVVNFYTVSAYAPRIPGRTATVGEVSRVRRREDRCALQKLNPGISIHDCDLLDAPLRLSVQTQAVSGPDAAPVRKCDVSEIVLHLLPLISKTAVVIAPLGLGNHVDHRTVRDAAICSVAGNRLAFYEDLPYASWTSHGDLARFVRDVEVRTHFLLRPRVIRGDLAKKERLASLYASQIPEADAALIARFGSRYHGGERIWLPQHSPHWSQFGRC